MKMTSDIEKKLNNKSTWDEIMCIIEEIENTIVKGTIELISLGKTEECEYQFTVDIKDKQCYIHRFVSPQYYGEETDYLNLHDCRNTSKKKAVILAIKTWRKWMKNQKIVVH